MSKRKYKEFNVLPVGQNFVLKDKDGIDTVFITMVGEGDKTKAFTYARAISLRGGKADGEAGLNRLQVAEALRLTDKEEFEGWWQNEISSRTTGPNDKVSITSAGDVFLYHDGTFNNLGKLRPVLKIVAEGLHTQVEFANSLAESLGIDSATAEELVKAIRTRLAQHCRENNNDNFSVLQDKFTTSNSLKEAITPMVCPKREDEDTNIDDSAKVTTGTSTDGGYYLPSGTKINVEDLLQPGKIFEHNSTANHYVVEKLAKIRSSEDDEWCAAVIYHPVTKPKETFAQPIPLFIKKMTAVLQTYEIWLEGYRATGADWKAEKMGEAQGYCFAEACNALFTRLGVQQNLNLSNPVRPYVVGRGDLYDNEKAARAFNG